MQFKDQTVIITGGTRGIGKGITEAFLKQGATAIATYASNDKAAEEFRTSLGELGEKLILKKFNVADSMACKDFYTDITQKFEQIHILINNSGIRKDSLGASLNEKDWDDVLNINLKGSFNMTQNAILNMMNFRYGRIINISSVGGKLGLAGQSNYAASKAGQLAMAKSLSKEIAKRKITINSVCPGFIETELLNDLDEDLVKNYKSQIPMKRFGTVEEVAHAVLFLASKEASYITGTSIDISGGL